jgi:hypothetical protein
MTSLMRAILRRVLGDERRDHERYLEDLRRREVGALERIAQAEQKRPIDIKARADD